MTKKRVLENFHWPLFGTLVALLIIGSANLYSAVNMWGEGSKPQLFWNQILWFGIGFLVMALVIWMDYRLWERLGWLFYGFTLLLLILVLLVGKDVSGHRSWLALGSLSIQPSEFAKLGLILILAKFFADNPQPLGFGFFRLWQPILLTLVPFALVLLQKDLGSSLFFPLILITMAFVAKVKKSTVIFFVCLLAVGGGLSYQYGLKPYQKERIKIFLNPEADPKRSGYHLIQSKIAVGSGKIFGKGYMKGTINKLRYLPDKHTDFIFPVLAEEWGFVGALVTVALFGFLILSGAMIAIKAREAFGIFLGIGVVALLFWHLVINVGGVLGMLPLTGVPLPFLSYGGSSTLAFLMGVGLLLNINMRRFMF